MPRKSLCLVVTVLAAALLGGCAKPEGYRFLWPVPPSEPRLEYIGLYRAEADFKKGGFEKASAQLLGEVSEPFAYPFGVASDGQGKVYVSDPGQQNIRVLDYKQRKSYFFSDRPMGTPYDLALDAAGRLYAADTRSKSVLVYDAATHTALRRIGGPDIFGHPVFVAVNDRLGRLYVTDVKGAEIEVFDLEGQHLFAFGGAGSGEGQFNRPQGLAIGADDRVYVADALNARVQVFDADGKFLSLFGTRGDALSQLVMPKDLAFDRQGHLHVVDTRKGALLTFDADGTFLLYTGTGEKTSGPLGFGNPTAIAIDRTDRIYIVDLLNKRLSIWQYLNPDYLREHPVTEEDLRVLEEKARAAEAEKKQEK